MVDFSRKGLIFCLVGPAGVGKSSLAKELLEQYGPHLTTSVSVTSRIPRDGEIPGESYVFVSRDEFQSMIDKKELLEWEETHGNFYGTRRENFEASLHGGWNLLMDIDIRGARSFRSLYPQQTVVLALLPPDADSLEGRMKGRGSTSTKEMQTRMETAKRELDTVSQEIGPNGIVDFVVINKDFGESKKIVSAIFLAAMNRGEGIEEKSFQTYIESLQRELS